MTCQPIMMCWHTHYIALLVCRWACSLRRTETAHWCRASCQPLQLIQLQQGPRQGLQDAAPHSCCTRAQVCMPDQPVYLLTSIISWACAQHMLNKWAKSVQSLTQTTRAACVCQEQSSDSTPHTLHEAVLASCQCPKNPLQPVAARPGQQMHRPPLTCCLHEPYTLCLKGSGLGLLAAQIGASNHMPRAGTMHTAENTPSHTKASGRWLNKGSAAQQPPVRSLHLPVHTHNHTSFH
jgi:hypothetical protein